MKPQKKSNIDRKTDFTEKYEEIMRIVKRDMSEVQRNWHFNGEQIKKFTLLQDTPFTIHTDNSNS